MILRSPLELIPPTPASLAALLVSGRRAARLPAGVIQIFAAMPLATVTSSLSSALRLMSA